MPTITLCEQRQLAPNQFEAVLRFEGGGQYPVTIDNPFGEQQEGQVWAANMAASPSSKSAAALPKYA